MCWQCYSNLNASNPLEASVSEADGPSRRVFLNRLGGAGLGFTALLASHAHAQVDVGQASGIRKLIPADTLEASARQQYRQTLGEAESKGALAPDDYPQLKRLRAIAAKLIPFTAQWNPDSRKWKWEVNLIGSKQINAWCMPGGKIAFYTGILDQLQLTDDEVAMIMGHEMAHALREHSRERLAKSRATGMGLSVASQLLGLGQLGDVAANLGTQLLTLKYGRDDETEADLVGLEIAARGGFKPEASVQLWKKMLSATGAGKGQLPFLSTHPSGNNRIQELEANLPKVAHLYAQAIQGRGTAPLN
ncbi:MAG: M48 family metallopeptidase [Comamonadaceae bacterium]|jgi:Zn-dependent protease with chaperone function|nr:M48 family metallopeptidase [Comamonadaceae bacterium]